MKKRKPYGREPVVWVKKTPATLPFPDPAPLPSDVAPEVEPSEREETKARYPRSTQRRRGRAWGYRARYSQQWEEESPQEYIIPEKYARVVQQYSHGVEPSTTNMYQPHVEKLMFKERESKYKDYSKDKVSVSFYYGDFFKQVPVPWSVKLRI